MPFRALQVLVVSIQAPLTNGEFADLLHAVASRPAAHTAGVVVDVTALDVVDSLAVRTFRELARLTRLAGAETVIVGIQPEVAFAMARFGATLHDITTTRDLQEALAYLERMSKEHG
jgi:rsbT antagonist protein RsbS